MTVYVRVLVWGVRLERCVFVCVFVCMIGEVSEIPFVLGVGPLHLLWRFLNGMSWGHEWRQRHDFGVLFFVEVYCHSLAYMVLTTWNRSVFSYTYQWCFEVYDSKWRRVNFRGKKSRTGNIKTLLATDSLARCTERICFETYSLLLGVSYHFIYICIFVPCNFLYHS